MVKVEDQHAFKKWGHGTGPHNSYSHVCCFYHSLLTNLFIYLFLSDTNFILIKTILINILTVLTSTTLITILTIFTTLPTHNSTCMYKTIHTLPNYNKILMLLHTVMPKNYNTCMIPLMSNLSAEPSFD